MKFICLILLLSLGMIQAQESSPSNEWENYFALTLNADKPRQTTKLAHDLFVQEGQITGLAVDLGFGTGRDSLFLLRQGWKVFALDAARLAKEILLHRAEAEGLSNLELEIASFSEMVLPKNIDLINASFSLPFSDLQAFPAIWKNIVENLRIGGRFSGQFFGDEDEWAQEGSGVFLTENQFLELFNDNFEIEHLNIEKGPNMTANGTIKFWHIFHVVAKKVK